MDRENKPPFNISSHSLLEEAFEKHCVPQLALIRFKPVFSKPRLHDIFCAWKEDLQRSERNFRNAEITPDHIKAAAHLTYWIRREAPIIDLMTMVDSFPRNRPGGQYDENETIQIELDIEKTIPDSTEISDDELRTLGLIDDMTFEEFKAARKRARVYGNELFAFSFGFALAKTYEEQKRKERGPDGRSIAWPSGLYIDDLCYFLKFKNVSPHSLDLIYRALLMVPDQT